MTIKVCKSCHQSIKEYIDSEIAKIENAKERWKKSWMASVEVKSVDIEIADARIRTLKRLLEGCELV